VKESTSSDKKEFIEGCVEKVMGRIYFVVLFRMILIDNRGSNMLSYKVVKMMAAKPPFGIFSSCLKEGESCRIQGLSVSPVPGAVHLIGTPDCCWAALL
jgi:hypothetical protein